MTDGTDKIEITAAHLEPAAAQRDKLHAQVKDTVDQVLTLQDPKKVSQGLREEIERDVRGRLGEEYHLHAPAVGAKLTPEEYQRFRDWNLEYTTKPGVLAEDANIEKAIVNRMKAFGVQPGKAVSIEQWKDAVSRASSNAHIPIRELDAHQVTERIYTAAHPASDYSSTVRNIMNYTGPEPTEKQLKLAAAKPQKVVERFKINGFAGEFERLADGSVDAVVFKQFEKPTRVKIQNGFASRVASATSSMGSFGGFGGSISAEATEKAVAEALESAGKAAEHTSSKWATGIKAVAGIGAVASIAAALLARGQAEREANVAFNGAESTTLGVAKSANKYEMLPRGLGPER